MSSGDSGLVLVMVMSGVFCMMSSIGLGYTCTGGSFDPDDFDMDKCLEWPKKSASTSNTTPTSTTTPGGGGGGNNIPPAEDAPPECTGLFSEAISTCYSANGGLAGLRWEWTDSDESRACKDLATYYRIAVSSSKDNHLTKWAFPLQAGGENNAFNFNNAPSGWLAEQNIKFYITPLNSGEQRISDEVIAVLDTNNSSETCNAHGDPVSMTEAELVTSPSEDEDEGPPPATDCTGGTWSAWGPCMSDGRALDATEDCGQMGVKTRELSGYTPAAHGGTCNTSDTTDCYMPSCPPDEPDIQDCIMEPWTSVIGTSESGETLYMDDVTGAKTCSAACNTSNMAPGMSYPGGAPGGGKRVETRGIDTPRGKDGGAACGKLREEYDCNTHDCPQNCSGSWSDMPNVATTLSVTPSSTYNNCKCSVNKKQIYRHIIPRLGGGVACDTAVNAERWATETEVPCNVPSCPSHPFDSGH